MHKIAELAKEAEVRGALAAFVDAGLVKVAGQEAFDKLAAAVCESLGEEDYTLEKVAQVTDACVAKMAVASDADSELRKVAMEVDARKKALGELMLLKVAGKIDDASFQKTASTLMDPNVSFPV